MDASRVIIVGAIGGTIGFMIILLLIATGAFGDGPANRLARLVDRWGSTTPREVSRTDTIRTVREAAALAIALGFVAIIYSFVAPQGQQYTWAAKAFGPGVFLVIGGVIVHIVAGWFAPGQVDRQEDRPR